MSKKLVTHTFGNHPQFAEKRLARLKALENKPDEKIDTSDIPVLSDAEWAEIVPLEDVSTDPARAHTGKRNLGVEQDKLRVAGTPPGA